MSVPRGSFVAVPALADTSIPRTLATVELSADLPDLELGIGADGLPTRAIQILVRLHGHPVGLVLVVAATREREAGVVPAERVATEIWEALREEVQGHMNNDGFSEVAALSSSGLPGDGGDPCRWQNRLGRKRPTATISIATCGEDPARLVACVRSALAQTYDHVDVIVVDNRPGRSRAAEALREAFGDDSRLYYVTEPTQGLGAVRNRSARESAADVVALTDDDVELDPDWLGFLVSGFDRPEVACVTGMILPSELRWRGQFLIEQYGGFSKGFGRARWDLGEHRHVHPLYPYLLGIYGSGANAAWRREALAELGGYDERLGVGTRTRGGEDLDMYLSCIRGGRQLVYEPAAIVFHHHRRDVGLIRRQVFGYGTALGVVLTKHLMRPEERSELIRRLPAGMNYLLNPRSPKNAGKATGFPVALTLSELAGVAYGPLAYLRSCRGA